MLGAETILPDKPNTANLTECVFVTIQPKWTIFIDRLLIYVDLDKYISNEMVFLCMF